MTNDPLDAMKARWNHIQGTLFPWLREEVDPMTEALGRLGALRGHDMNTPCQSIPGRAACAPACPAEASAELHLNHRDEVRGTERAPVRAAFLEPAEPRLLVERQFQDIGDGDPG